MCQQTLFIFRLKNSQSKEFMDHADIHSIIVMRIRYAANTMLCVAPTPTLNSMFPLLRRCVWKGDHVGCVCVCLRVRVFVSEFYVCVCMCLNLCVRLFLVVHS